MRHLGLECSYFMKQESKKYVHNLTVPSDGKVELNVFLTNIYHFNMWTHCVPEILLENLWIWNELSDMVLIFKEGERPEREGTCLWSNCRNIQSYKSEVKVTQLCLDLYNLVAYTVHGILQARVLEWVAYPFSSGSSQPRNRTRLSCISGRFFTNWAIGKAP